MKPVLAPRGHFYLSFSLVLLAKQLAFGSACCSYEHTGLTQERPGLIGHTCPEFRLCNALLTKVRRADGLSLPRSARPLSQGRGARDSVCLGKLPGVELPSITLAWERRGKWITVPMSHRLTLLTKLQQVFLNKCAFIRVGV